MATFTKFNILPQDLAHKVHNLASDTLKVALSNVAPVAGNIVLANITQIAAGNGYASGGSTVTVSSSGQTGGIYKLVCADLTFTAAGGAIPAFQYAILYNSTASGGPLIGWWAYDTSAGLASGETFLVDFDATNGVFTVA